MSQLRVLSFLRPLLQKVAPQACAPPWRFAFKAHETACSSLFLQASWWVTLLAPSTVGQLRWTLSQPLRVSTHMPEEKVFYERLRVPSLSGGGMVTVSGSQVRKVSSAVLHLSAHCHVWLHHVKVTAELRKEEGGSSRLRCCHLIGFSQSSHFFLSGQSPDCCKLQLIFRFLKMQIPF